MQTNHLSHFLLSKELLPLLNKAAASKGEARIVNHSSGARKFPSSPLEAKYLGKNGGNLGGNGNSMLFGGARWQRYHQVCMLPGGRTFSACSKNVVEKNGG
jgi:NAD(P)-dependent dehydrogenase (short-subunit alcohol dehydrogenase family)